MKTSKPITERQQAFLETYRTTGLVKPAAAQAGCSRELHYGALRTSETYREAFAFVQPNRADELEEEARRLAIYGVKIPILFRGKVIGYETRYSDTLLMVLPEANNPEKVEGIREELQEQDRDAGFYVRWDRDEIARPTLPRMTGPQPPVPPRPPRPPVPSARECSEPVEYAEWAAARGLAGAPMREPPDEAKLDLWAAGADGGSVEWGPEEIATDATGDSAEADPCQAAVAGIDRPGSNDSDAGFCVRSESRDGDAGLPPRRGPASLGEPFQRPWVKERRATSGHALRRACHTLRRPRRGGSDGGFCVRSHSRSRDASDVMPRPPPPGIPGRGSSPFVPAPKECTRNVGRFLNGSASGEGRGEPLHPNRV